MKPKWATQMMACLLALSVSYTVFRDYIKPQFYSYLDGEVQRYYAEKFTPRFTYQQCEVWIEYKQVAVSTGGLNRLKKRVEEAIFKFNKYMILVDYQDLGGYPGIQLVFADFCDQKYQLAEIIAKDLEANLPHIQKAVVLKDSGSRQKIIPPQATSFHLPVQEGE